MPKSNRYAQACADCGAQVNAGAGILNRNGRRWAVTHEDCTAPGNTPRPPVRRMVGWRTSGGTFYTNANGRCEDAPCCGCCS